MQQPKALADHLSAIKSNGFRAFKIGWGPFGRESAKLDEAIVRAAREAVGTESLLMVDAGGCDEFCRRKLFTLRQLRLTQGKDMERIERAWLLSDDVTPSADVVSAYAGTWIVRAAGSELLRQLPAARSLSDHIYVIDPLGNLVLRYARDADPVGIIKDLARLLKISRIG